MSLIKQPFIAMNDANGKPYSGALAYFYQTGTTTPATVYQDNALTTPHASPVVANSEGRFPAIFALGAPPLRMKIISATGTLVSPLLDIDPVTDTGATVSGLGKNLVINGNFQVNQRGYVSGATLAVGVFGHDRFRAGAGGGDYTFTQLPSDTQITILANKTLIHPIEDHNIAGGSYVVSWSGTSMARLGVNGSVPSGVYAPSPIMVSGVNAGQQVGIEFNAGTLGSIQFEAGVSASTFERRLFSQVLEDCHRYCYVWKAPASGFGGFGQSVLALDSTAAPATFSQLYWPNKMRGIPTLTQSGAFGIELDDGGNQGAAMTFADTTDRGVRIHIATNGLATIKFGIAGAYNDPAAKITASAEI